MALLTTYSNKKLEPLIDPFGEWQINVAFLPTQNIARGTALGIITASGLVKPYASGNADGSQKPVYLAVYDMQIDGSGNVTLSSTASQAGGDYGLAYLTAPVALSGTFAAADLVGLDAAAITNNPSWNLVGSLTAGTLRIG